MSQPQNIQPVYGTLVLCFSPLWCKNVMLHHTTGVILWRKNT